VAAADARRRVVCDLNDGAQRRCGRRSAAFLVAVGVYGKC
jgi:hypothetical protein